MSKTYEDGLNEAWELVRKLIYGESEYERAYSIEDINAIFGKCGYLKILKDYTASEAIKQVKEYEEKQKKIKVGDEVVNKYGWKRVVTNTHINGEVTLMDSNGDFYAYCKEEVSDLDLKKTGGIFRR